MEVVRTVVSFVDSEFPEIEFAFGGYLDEAQGRAAMARAQSDEVQSMGVDALTDEESSNSSPLSAASTVQEEPKKGEPKQDLFGDTSKTAPVEEPKQDLFGSAEQPTEQPTELKDSAGTVYDTTMHAVGPDGGPVYTSTGAFRKRRGTGKKPVADPVAAVADPVVEPVADPVAAVADVDDILDSWG